MPVPITIPLKQIKQYQLKLKLLQIAFVCIARNAGPHPITFSHFLHQVDGTCVNTVRVACCGLMAEAGGSDCPEGPWFKLLVCM